MTLICSLIAHLLLEALGDHARENRRDEALEGHARLIDARLRLVHHLRDRGHLRLKQLAYGRVAIDRHGIHARTLLETGDGLGEDDVTGQPFVADRRVVDQPLLGRDHGARRAQQVGELERDLLFLGRGHRRPAAGEQVHSDRCGHQRQRRGTSQPPRAPHYRYGHDAPRFNWEISSKSRQKSPKGYSADAVPATPMRVSATGAKPRPPDLRPAAGPERSGRALYARAGCSGPSGPANLGAPQSTILCPVASQSLRNAASPFSVSGCWIS